MKVGFLNKRHFSVYLLTVLLFLTACQSTGLSRQQVATLQQQGFDPTEEGWELNLSSKLLFEFDNDALGEAGSRKVQEVTRALVRVGLVRVRLDGHTDSVGGSEYNVALSHRRASRVAEIMVSSGMLERDIEIRAMGSSRPVVNNDTEEGRAENRRVSIVVLTP